MKIDSKKYIVEAFASATGITGLLVLGRFMSRLVVVLIALMLSLSLSGCNSETVYQFQVANALSDPMASEQLLGLELVSKEDPPTSVRGKPPAVHIRRVFAATDTEDILHAVVAESSEQGWEEEFPVDPDGLWSGRKQDSQGSTMTIVVMPYGPGEVSVEILY